MADLRGMAAVGSLALSSKRSGGGGGKRNPRGALNAAHRVLAASGTPLNGQQLAIHALGLGWWESDAGHPINGLVHSVNDNLRSDTNPTGVFVKPQPGVFALAKDAPPPLVPADGVGPRPDMRADEKALYALNVGVYHVCLKQGVVKPLKGVVLPELTVTPQQIACFLAGVESVEKAPPEERAVIEGNVAAIEELLTSAD